MTTSYLSEFFGSVSGILSFIGLIAVTIAAGYIFRSVYFNLWESRGMKAIDKMKLAISDCYDIKWSFFLTIAFVIFSVRDFLNDSELFSKDILFLILFILALASHAHLRKLNQARLDKMTNIMGCF